MKFNAHVARAIETEMVKALKSVGRAKMMREVEKIQLNALREGKERACLDSGANRAARTMRNAGEMERAETVQVELANGSMATLKKNDRGTLLSETEIQTIIPLIPIMHMGYKLKRRGDGFVLERGQDIIHLHRDTGTLECEEAEGQKLLEELESLGRPAPEQGGEGEEEETDLVRVLRHIEE